MNKSKQEAKLIRSYLKKGCPSLKVKMGTGTAYCWIDVEGSEEFGYLNQNESLALFEMGVIDNRLIGTKQYSISPEHKRYLLKLWGLN